MTRQPAGATELDGDAGGEELEGADGPPVKEDRNYVKATADASRRA
ncbi:hypothetical protein ABZ442_20400 [Streptomyces triculaminicus]